MGVIWRKVWRDLKTNKNRTLVVVLAIAVGVMTFGSVFTTQAVLRSEMSSQFRAINPSNLVVNIPKGFNPGLVRWVENHDGVSFVRASSYPLVRLFTKKGARNLNLLALEDFENIILNTIDPEKGSWPPRKKEIVLERTSATILGGRLGETLEVETEDGRRRRLNFVGVVHDMQAIPANLFPQLSGYVSFETLSYLNLPTLLTRLEIRTNKSISTKDEVTTLGNQIKTELENRGFKEISIRADKLDKHWGEDPSNAFLAIMSIIGSFSLALSVFLVFNTMSAIVVQQKKQVGIMKAVGGKNTQIVPVFLTMAISYGAVALVIAIPLGALLAYGNLALIANFLNLNIENFHIPLNVLLMEAVASLIVPVAAALLPVLSGTRITVREALSDFSVQKKTRVFFEDFFQGLEVLSRPLIISLRNTFRQKGRLVMTLLTLTIAGTLFISVIGNRQSMMLELDNILKLYRYDLQLFFSEPYSATKTVFDAKKVEGVTTVEAPLYLKSEWEKEDEDQNSSITLSGIDPLSDFMEPTLMSGRLVTAEDTNKIVVASRTVRDNPGLKVGQILPLKINNRTYEFEVIGVYTLLDENTALISKNYFETIAPQSDQITSIQIRSEGHSDEYLSRLAKDLEQQMKRRGYNIAYSLTINTIRSTSEGQFNFMVLFLLIMAIMVAIVGGLSLAGTMSLNVFERTREIGVMRSIGASNNAVFQLVVVESLLVGLMSWLLAVPLSIPMSYGFCVAIGMAFFEKVLPFVFSTSGAFIWLAIVVVISVAASLAPARNAVNLTVRDTLSYE